MKGLGIILIIGIFVAGFIALYLGNKKKPVQPAPAVVSEPGFEIPNWRILPYDPAKIGQSPVYDPASPVKVRMHDPNRNLLV